MTDFVGSAARRIGAFARREPVAALGLVVIVAMAVVAAFAGTLAPYDPLDTDFGAMLAPPSREHWAGTDSFGRDLLTRLMFGARTALLIGIVASLLGSTVGAAIGALSAYVGGRFDLIVQRVLDVMLVIPSIVTALVVVSILGRNRGGLADPNLVLAIAIPFVPNVARVIRSAALSIRELPYMDAARVCGYGHARIVAIHLLPNLAAPFIVMATAYVGQAILLEAALAFVGLGVSEPFPSWGLMLAGNASDFYQQAPWVVLAPGLAITLVVFAFNLFGDGLRDHLDPRRSS